MAHRQIGSTGPGYYFGAPSPAFHKQHSKALLPYYQVITRYSQLMLMWKKWDYSSDAWGPQYIN